MWSPVEKSFLDKSELPYTFPNECIKTIQTTNVYELGKLISLRFLEWVQENPSGVVALPTGRTPEFFIKTLENYKRHWTDAPVQEEVKRFGLSNAEVFPDTRGLHFVMLDEFFPLRASHRNSFCRYIRTYYIELLEIPPHNVSTFDFVEEGVVTEEELLLFSAAPEVDLSLLQREPASEEERAQRAVLQKISEYCDLYEQRIHDMGGISFFLGGIGPGISPSSSLSLSLSLSVCVFVCLFVCLSLPLTVLVVTVFVVITSTTLHTTLLSQLDGHIAFNQYGDSLTSTTRLVRFNYPSAAAAAGDLGGIEHSRGRAAATIGLRTITARPGASIILLAAGEGKAEVVRRALEEAVSGRVPGGGGGGMQCNVS
jgi:glucosamine-6-phosphate deaminase